MAKPPKVRFSFEFSGKWTRTFHLPPRWILWILLLVLYALTHGQVHLPALPTA